MQASPPAAAMPTPISRSDEFRAHDLDFHAVRLIGGHTVLAAEARGRAAAGAPR